jgi:hypothetical protein
VDNESPAATGDSLTFLFARDSDRITILVDSFWKAGKKIG